MSDVIALRAETVTPSRADGDTAWVRRTLRAGLLTQTTMRFDPGRSGARESGNAEIAWFVVGGRGVLTLSSAGSVAETAQYELAPDTGVYIPPHTTCQVENPGPEVLEIVAVAADDPVSGVNQSAAARRAPRLASGLAVRWADRPEERAGGDRRFRVLVGGDVGAAQMTQFVGEIPHGAAPPHHHTYEEVIYVLAGEGKLHADDTSTPIGPGSCLLLPRGVVHCLENTATETLRILGVFHPAGSPAEAYEA